MTKPRLLLHAMLALAGQTDAVALIDACRDFDGQRLVLLDAPGAAAVAAGVGDEAAGAMAFRTGLLNREKALLQANLAGAVAGRAGLGLGAGLGAGTVTLVAGLHRRNTDLGFRAVGRLFERDIFTEKFLTSADGANASARSPLFRSI